MDTPRVISSLGELIPRFSAEDDSGSRTTTDAASSTTSVTMPSSSVALYATNLNGVNLAMNTRDRNFLWWSLGILAMAVLVVRIYQMVYAHSRHLSALNATRFQQRYWSRNTSTSVPLLKKHLIYAPLLRKRHNREIRLSSAINVGTLPSRAHALILTGYLVSNMAYCASLDYKQDKYACLAELRGRSGSLSVANMIALIILAGRNNPLITMLKVSFDTYNLLHRWMGRMVVLEAVLHTLAWALVKVPASGWSGFDTAMTTDPFIIWGTVGTVFMLLIVLTSLSPVRHAFYETFLNVHIVLVIGTIVGVYVHCDVAHLPQLLWVKVVLILWGAERLFRCARIIYTSYSRKGWATATITALPGDSCRVTLHLPRKMDAKPGSHAYLRFGGLNFWESHPFSIAWLDHVTPTSPTLPRTEKSKSSLASMKTTTDVSFIIQAQTGITRRLQTRAAAVAPRALELRAAFEGPYAGHHSLDSYGHVLLFAGSSGITHQVPFMSHLLEGYNEGTVATRRITLVWIVRDLEHLEWVRPWMDKILQVPNRREVVQIKLFVTRPRNPRDISSPSQTVQMFSGRPNIKLLVEQEQSEQVGAMCVTVCGPGGLADNVREVVRGVQKATVVDFIEESFTW
ncbi:MAG: hypothetical protein M1818_008267 [Claussenomyces sp. TS43310]|nr:MAG: hypothetical protein M1818_008267 [Claussenomyces sp. TS43310]